MSVRLKPRHRSAAGFLSIGVVAFLVGPRTGIEPQWLAPVLPADLDAYVREQESLDQHLLPGHGAKIVWAGAPAVRTPLAIVYLHGFSADPHEVDPLVTDLGRELGANIFYARLTGHASDDPAALGSVSVNDWLEDTARAVTIGESIGDRIVLIGTSTGGTLAVWAATRDEAADRLAALILLSPNLGLHDRRSGLLLWPWGNVLVRMLLGPIHTPDTEFTPEQRLHWTTSYPSTVLLEVGALVHHVRSLEPGSLGVPALSLYSPEDQVVDADAIPKVLNSLSSQLLEIDTIDGVTSDKSHIIAGDLMSPNTTDVVHNRIVAFLDTIHVGR